jgi:hypothetical protein
MAEPMAVKAQFPIRGIGNAMQDAFVGLEQVYFTGATGLIGTAYGMPGITVTRTSTGMYSISYPPVSPQGRCAIIPGIECPSGQAYDAMIVQNFPNSGTAQLNLTQPMQFIGSGAVPVSGTTRPVNPASGTILNLLFVGGAVAKF